MNVLYITGAIFFLISPWVGLYYVKKIVSTDDTKTKVKYLPVLFLIGVLEIYGLIMISLFLRNYLK